MKTMASPLRQFSGIAGLTALEASRQPIFLLLTTSVLLLIALMPALITHVIGDSARMVRDSALALQMVAGLALGCHAASATLTRELQKGTLASILSKPVSRELFLLAKFAGVALIMGVFALVTTLAAMLSVRSAAQPFTIDPWGMIPLIAALLTAYAGAGLLNYYRQIPFVSRAYGLLTFSVILAFAISGLAGGASLIPWNIFPAGVLIGLATLLLSAWAVCLATRLQPIPVFSICLTVLLLGLMSDYLFGRHAGEHMLYAALYGVIPNWQHFWAVDALQRDGIPWSYAGRVAGYTAAHAAAVLSLGLLSFNRVEVK